MSTDATRRTRDTTAREFHAVEYAELVVQRAWRRERRKKLALRALRYLAAPVIGFCALQALGLWASHLLGQPFPWGFSVITALAMLEAAVAYPPRAVPPRPQPRLMASPCERLRMLRSVCGQPGPNDDVADGGYANPPPDSHREVA
jgi:hypothetical protein